MAGDGTIWVFWSSGGNGGDLYYYSKGASDGSFNFEGSLSDQFYFNVEAVSAGGTTYLYYEDGTGSGVFVREFDGSSFSAPTPVTQSGYSIPKVMIDANGTFRLTAVNTAGDFGSVYVASSPDGVTWSAPLLAAPAVPPETNWDPSLIQTPDGIFHLYYAPDDGGNPSSQRLEERTSADFTVWSAPTLATDPEGYWDYWPEAIHSDGSLRLFYTSEAATPSNDAGTGHIWSITASISPTSKDDCKNGGWETFGYRNQGQCIKFVNTGT